MHTSFQQKEQTVGRNTLKILYAGCELDSYPQLNANSQREFDLDFSRLPSKYPYDRYLKLVERIRKELFSNYSVDIGYEKIGRGITNLDLFSVASWYNFKK